MLPGPPSPAGWRCLSGKTSTALALLVGSSPVPTSRHCTVHVSVPTLRCLHGISRRSLLPAAGTRQSILSAGALASASQHALEDKSCWVLLLFYCLLGDY